MHNDTRVSASTWSAANQRSSQRAAATTAYRPLTATG